MNLKVTLDYQLDSVYAPGPVQGVTQSDPEESVGLRPRRTVGRGTVDSDSPTLRVQPEPRGLARAGPSSALKPA